MDAHSRYARIREITADLRALEKTRQRDFADMPKDGEKALFIAASLLDKAMRMGSLSGPRYAELRHYRLLLDGEKDKTLLLLKAAALLIPTPDGVYEWRWNELFDKLADVLEEEARQKAALPDNKTTSEIPAGKGEGVAPRNRMFLEWYEALGTDTYHKPAKIHAKWQGMTQEQRAAICPDSPNKITKAAVEKGIQRARQERDRNKPAKPKRKSRKKA